MTQDERIGQDAQIISKLAQSYQATPHGHFINNGELVIDLEFPDILHAATYANLVTEIAEDGLDYFKGVYNPYTGVKVELSSIVDTLDMPVVLTLIKTY